MREARDAVSLADVMHVSPLAASPRLGLYMSAGSSMDRTTRDELTAHKELVIEVETPGRVYFLRADIRHDMLMWAVGLQRLAALRVDADRWPADLGALPKIPACVLQARREAGTLPQEVALALERELAAATAAAAGPSPASASTSTAPPTPLRVPAATVAGAGIGSPVPGPAPMPATAAAAAASTATASRPGSAAARPGSGATTPTQAPFGASSSATPLTFSIGRGPSSSYAVMSPQPRMGSGAGAAAGGAGGAGFGSLDAALAAAATPGPQGLPAASSTPSTRDPPRVQFGGGATGGAPPTPTAARGSAPSTPKGQVAGPVSFGAGMQSPAVREFVLESDTAPAPATVSRPPSGRVGTATHLPGADDVLNSSRARSSVASSSAASSLNSSLIGGPVDAAAKLGLVEAALARVAASGGPGGDVNRSLLDQSSVGDDGYDGGGRGAGAGAGRGPQRPRGSAGSSAPAAAAAAAAAAPAGASASARPASTQSATSGRTGSAGIAGARRSVLDDSDSDDDGGVDYGALARLRASASRDADTGAAGRRAGGTSTANSSVASSPALGPRQPQREQAQAQSRAAPTPTPASESKEGRHEAARQQQQQQPQPQQPVFASPSRPRTARGHRDTPESVEKGAAGTGGRSVLTPEASPHLASSSGSWDGDDDEDKIPSPQQQQQQQQRRGAGAGAQAAGGRGPSSAEEPSSWMNEALDGGFRGREEPGSARRVAARGGRGGAGGTGAGDTDWDDWDAELSPDAKRPEVDPAGRKGGRATAAEGKHADSPVRGEGGGRGGAGARTASSQGTGSRVGSANARPLTDAELAKARLGDPGVRADADFIDADWDD